MGVNCKHYVIIGYNLQPAVEKMNADQLDTFLEEIERLSEQNHLKLIFDGMSGEYCFIGQVLNEGKDYEGMMVKEHWVSDLKEIEDTVYNNSAFIGHRRLPALYTFSHWY